MNHLKEKWISVFTTWLGVFPLLTLISWLFDPIISNQTVLIRCLIMSMIMVPIMVLCVMPAMQSIVIKQID